MKTNAAKQTSAAQEGLEDLIEMEGESTETLTAPTNTAPVTDAELTSAGDLDEEEDLQVVSDGARVEIFFVHKIKPGKTLGANQRIVAEGQEFFGKYAGSFTSGKFDSRTQKLTLTKDTEGAPAGTVVGLPTCGKLDKNFQFVPDNTTSLVKYNGSAEIKTGKWKGSDAYLYDVAIPAKIRQAIKDGTLPANYELKAQGK